MEEEIDDKFEACNMTKCEYDIDMIMHTRSSRFMHDL